MHKLLDFVCDEMEELERKVDKDGKLSMAEVQYLDTLAHTKKNLLKSDEMYDDEYSGRYDGRMYDGRMRDGMVYARGRKRDAMGRYASDSATMMHELRQLMDDAPDERTKMEFKKFIEKMERM
jgi:hypothetical protein